jgi:DNA-binding protein HU-beta
MTKQELIDEVARRAQLDRPQAAAAVDATLSAVTETLGNGGEVSLTGFGRFHVGTRGARAGVNPRTGNPMRIPDTVVPRFTAGTRLKAAVRP